MDDKYIKTHAERRDSVSRAISDSLSKISSLNVKLEEYLKIANRNRANGISDMFSDLSLLKKRMEKTIRMTDKLENYAIGNHF